MNSMTFVAKFMMKYVDEVKSCVTRFQITKTYNSVNWKYKKLINFFSRKTFLWVT